MRGEEKTTSQEEKTYDGEVSIKQAKISLLPTISFLINSNNSVNSHSFATNSQTTTLFQTNNHSFTTFKMKSAVIFSAVALFGAVFAAPLESSNEASNLFARVSYTRSRIQTVQIC